MLNPSLIDDYIGISVTGSALTGMVLKLISLWSNIVDHTKIIYLTGFVVKYMWGLHLQPFWDWLRTLSFFFIFSNGS